jgi:hypothetical protein
MSFVRRESKRHETKLGTVTNRYIDFFPALWAQLIDILFFKQLESILKEAHTRVQATEAGLTIVGGKVVIAGRRERAVLRAFCIKTWSIMTRLAMASTIGTARGTTHGSCLPRAASLPGVPSYWAVS